VDGVTWLGPELHEVAATEQLLGADHPHNPLVHRAMQDDEAAHAELVERYGDMADIWTAWTAAHADYYTMPLDRSLDRLPDGAVLELSAGTGAGTKALVAGGLRPICTEPTLPMAVELAALGIAPVVAAVSVDLPFHDGSFDAVVGLNAILAVDEVRRVLRPNGSLLWCYSFAESTPVFVSPELLSAAFRRPAVARRVGPGLWVHIEEIT
jgi:SAM-dependent methyltransferase